MAQKSEDARIRRTRQLLRQALFDLTIEKGFGAVTVRDIASQAMVNRSTFYRHYLDKYDLLNQLLDELQAEAAALASESHPAGSAPAGLLLVIRHVQQHAAFYRVMLGKNGDPVFAQRFRQLTEDRYRLLFADQEESGPPNAMKLSYIAHASLGGILWWLENDQPFSAEQLAIWIGHLNMTSAGLRA